MATHTNDPKRRVVSRTLRRLLDYSERQVSFVIVIVYLYFESSTLFVQKAFVGPPETTRDVIVAAATGIWLFVTLSVLCRALICNTAMLRGEWRRCANLIANLGCWSLFAQPAACTCLLTLVCTSH
jgi:hypothetical protein